MTQKLREEFLETEDLKEWINEYSLGIVKEVTKDNKNRKAKIIIKELDDL